MRFIVSPATAVRMPKGNQLATGAMPHDPASATGVTAPHPHANTAQATAMTMTVTVAERLWKKAVICRSVSIN